MLKEKSCTCVFGPRECFLQSAEESAGIGNDEERNTKSVG